MTKTKTDSNQVSIHQHQDYTVKWRQIQNSKQKWIVIKQPFLIEINGHRNICNKLGVVGKGLNYTCNNDNVVLLYVILHKEIGVIAMRRQSQCVFEKYNGNNKVVRILLSQTIC